METNRATVVLGTLILGLGILGAGFSIGKGVYAIRKLNRIVTVKGIAEQDVKSDLGIYEINYREMGDDLIQVDQSLLHDQEVVTTFLKTQGFTDNEIGRSQMRIEDRLANNYNQNNSDNAKPKRYVVTSGVLVRSNKVELIDKTVQLADKLIQQGIPLAFDASSQSPNPSYYFTKLDEIRPSMFAAATKSAYTIAQQFSEDSGSKLGKIQRASQGVFQIMGRDTSTMSSDWNSNQNAMGSIDKKVRLVTTIDYRLK